MSPNLRMVGPAARRVALMDLLASWRARGEWKPGDISRRQISEIHRAFGELTLEETGIIFDLTRERIRQIEEKAIGKMKAHIDRRRSGAAKAIREHLWN